MNDNAKLNAVLEQGETVLWSGVPQSYSLFDASRKKSTLVSVCMALACAAVLLGGYYSIAISKDIEVQKGVMAFLALAPLCIVWMPIGDKKRVKKLLYAITDRRAVVIAGDREDDKQIFMPLADIDGVSLEQSENGNCDLRIGSPALKAAVGKLPILAYFGKSSGEGKKKVYTGLVFFNMKPEDGKAAQTLLTSRSKGNAQ